MLNLKPYDRELDLPDFFLQKTLESTFINGDVPKGYVLKPGIKDLSFRPK